MRGTTSSGKLGLLKEGLCSVNVVVEARTCERGSAARKGKERIREELEFISEGEKFGKQDPRG